MNLVQQTLAEFGRSIGVDDLQLRENKRVVLTIQNIGTLAIELAGPRDQAVLVSLARPLAGGGDQSLTAFLTVAHYREAHPWPVHVGLWRDQRVLAVLLVPEQLDQALLNEIIRELDQLHTALGGST
jgi:type III secretion system chaperone SycN